MENGLEVGLASPEDFEGIWQLMQEAADQTDRSVGKEDLQLAAFGQEQWFEYITVKSKGKVVGIASIFNLFSTWEGHFLFIDEFLTPLSTEHSGQDGIDLILFKKLVQISLERDCCRLLQFFLKRSDSLLIEKYKGLGVTPIPEWFTVRLPGLALVQLAEQPSLLAGQYSIRPSVKKDVPNILYLIQCLAEYEMEPHAVKIDEKVLSEGFGKQCYYHCLIAETDIASLVTDSEEAAQPSSRDPSIVGIALYLTIYCKRKGKVLHLEDLFVKEKHRNQGLGTALMKECAKICISRGCKEMDWQVLDWNKSAINFYKRLGGIIFEDLLMMRSTRTT